MWLDHLAKRGQASREMWPSGRCESQIITWKRVVGATTRPPGWRPWPSGRRCECLAAAKLPCSDSLPNVCGVWGIWQRNEFLPTLRSCALSGKARQFERINCVAGVVWGGCDATNIRCRTCVWHLATQRIWIVLEGGAFQLPFSFWASAVTASLPPPHHVRPRLDVARRVFRMSLHSARP